MLLIVIDSVITLRGLLSPSECGGLYDHYIIDIKYTPKSVPYIIDIVVPISITVVDTPTTQSHKKLVHFYKSTSAGNPVVRTCANFYTPPIIREWLKRPITVVYTTQIRPMLMRRNTVM